MPKKEEICYLVPEVEIMIYEPWVVLIKYCQDVMPYGAIKVHISDAKPGKKLSETPNIRFDKQTVPKKLDGNVYLIKSIDLRVHEYWINLIKWCQDYFSKGDLNFQIVHGLPTELLSAKQDVRFDKPNTIMKGLPLNFIK